MLCPILFDELLGGLECGIAFLAFAFESDLILDLAVYCLLIFLAFPHDVCEDILFPMMI